MSDSVYPERVNQRSPYRGMLSFLTALLLSAAYFRNPQVTKNWDLSTHLMIRMLIVAFGTVGLFWLARTTSRYLTIPTWMRLIHYQMSIPLEGWIYLGIMFVLFTGAMLTNQNTLMLVFALMAGPFVINGWMTFGMLRAARVDRQAPRRAMQGELFSVALLLTNSRKLFSLWMISVRDEIKHAREKMQATVLFSRASPRMTVTGQYELRLAHRGRYTLKSLQIASRFPLGLVERSRGYSRPCEILIYPRIGRLAPHWRQNLAGATELVSRNQPHRGVFQDDFHRLREFRPGDNPKAIHWRSSARRGEVILREFHQNRDHTLAIVLDLFRSNSARADEFAANELALSFVASLLVERGRECHDGILSLVALGEQVFRWEGQGHTSSLELLFDGLAVFEPGSSHNICQHLNDTIERSTASTQIIVVTTRHGDLPYQDQLTPRVGLLNVSQAPAGSLLTFEDDRPRREVT